MRVRRKATILKAKNIFGHEQYIMLKHLTLNPPSLLTVTEGLPFQSHQ
jgi:hypothetical protein